MKTIVLILLVFFSFSLQKLCASDTLRLVANTTTTHQFCMDNGNDYLVIIPPVGTPSNGGFYSNSDGIYQDDADTLILAKHGAKEGQWLFGPYGVFFSLYFPSALELQWKGKDTIFCGKPSMTLNPQSTVKPGTSFVWSTGATTPTISLSLGSYGWYKVTVTNDCNSIVDSIHVIADPNRAQLGADQTVCWGSQVVLDPGSINVASYLWSTGATTSTIAVDTSKVCWVSVIDNTGCQSRDTVKVVALVPQKQNLCYVNFDTDTWKNAINWTTHLSDEVDSIRIYKEVATDVWVPIGTLESTLSSFVDYASDPQSQSYSYRIAAIDTCGNESSPSSTHTTITLLSAYDNPTNTYGFTWSKYVGITVSTYTLYGVTAANSIDAIGSVPGTQNYYNYVDPSFDYIKYFVGFNAPVCGVASKSLNVVKSNLVQSTITGISDLRPSRSSFSLYPNPSHGEFSISGEGSVDILNVIGKVVVHQQLAGTVKMSLSSGVYFARFTDTTGQIFIKKIVIQ